jgi:hypothetical protein
MTNKSNSDKVSELNYDQIKQLTARWESSSGKENEEICKQIFLELNSPLWREVESQEEINIFQQLAERSIEKNEGKECFFSHYGIFSACSGHTYYWTIVGKLVSKTDDAYSYKATGYILNEN